MSRSVLTAAHHAQLKALRTWARTVGNTPPAPTNAERAAQQVRPEDTTLHTTEANTEPVTAETPHFRFRHADPTPAPAPAPEASPQGNDDGNVHTESD